MPGLVQRSIRHFVYHAIFHNKTETPHHAHILERVTWYGDDIGHRAIADTTKIPFVP